MTAAPQASLSITSSWSLLKLRSIDSVMPSNHLILCCPLLLPPSIFPSSRVFSNKSALRIISSLSIVTFQLQQNWVTATGITGPAKPQILTVYLLTEKVCQPLRNGQENQTATPDRQKERESQNQANQNPRQWVWAEENEAWGPPSPQGRAIMAQLRQGLDPGDPGQRAGLKKGRTRGVPLVCTEPPLEAHVRGIISTNMNSSARMRQRLRQSSHPWV